MCIRDRVKEKYSCKKRPECAVCCHPFLAINLPMAISYKAVMDLRESWGVDIPPDPHLAKPPRCYDTVRVCLFCSQFFEDTNMYRPADSSTTARPPVDWETSLVLPPELDSPNGGTAMV